MKYLMPMIVVIVLATSCKKEQSSEATPAPQDTTTNNEPCPEGYYGANCDSAYGSLMLGEYEIYDSCLLNRQIQGKTYLIPINNTHTSMLFDSAGVFWFSNFWGKGERYQVTIINTNQIQFKGMLPHYKYKISGLADDSWKVYHWDKSVPSPISKDEKSIFLFSSLAEVNLSSAGSTYKVKDRLFITIKKK